jgi:two-component system response regulator NreC
LSPPLSERVIEMYVAGAKKSDVDAYELLTTREREVMHLAAEGLSNPAIGERLRISPRTVEIHRAHVVQKLGLRTRADLVIYALNRGLLPGKPEGALPSGLNGDANEG